MTSLDPSNYSREARGHTTIHARYAGRCHNCDEPTQATTLKTTTEATKSHVWVRCADCGTVTRVGKNGAEESNR